MGNKQTTNYQTHTNMESKTAFVQSVLRFASDDGFNSQTQASMVTNAYSIYKKYLQYGDRDAARHWVIKNRSRYGYKVVKHDPDAFTCFCQADFTSDEDHECSLCNVIVVPQVQIFWIPNHSKVS